eukprot:UN18814
MLNIFYTVSLEIQTKIVYLFF